MIGTIIGSAIGAAIATSDISNDIGSMHDSIKNLESRITESLKTIKGELDIIKALQILTIYGAKKDNVGNIVYTAEDNSKIEYNIENNDIRCYLSSGELFSINGVQQIIYKKLATVDGSIFDIGFYNNYVVIILLNGKPIEVPVDLPCDGNYSDTISSEYIAKKKVHWWNRKKRYKYLMEVRNKRISCFKKVNEFLKTYPEIKQYYDRWILNIRDSNKSYFAFEYDNSWPCFRYVCDLYSFKWWYRDLGWLLRR